MKIAGTILIAAMAGILPGQIVDDTQGNTVVKTPDSYDGPQRFQLFKGCKPIGLAVGRAFDNLQALGIAGDNVQEAAESRLRAARLYTGNARPSCT